MRVCASCGLDRPASSVWALMLRYGWSLAAPSNESCSLWGVVEKGEGDVGGRGQGEAHGEITRLGIAKGSNTWEGESRSVRLYAFEVGLSVCAKNAVCVKLCGWGCEWVRVEGSEYTPCGWRAGQNSKTVQSHSQWVTLSPASFMSTTNCFLASVVRPCLIGPLAELIHTPREQDWKCIFPPFLTKRSEFFFGVSLEVRSGDCWAVWQCKYKCVWKP